MKYRHEVKHYLNYADLLLIRQRMGAVCTPDPHATNGRYEIRSLYFDSPTDKALREKVDGLYERDKYRIRLYDMDTSFIRLERKSKRGSLGWKSEAKLSEEEVRRIVAGDTAWMADDGRGLVVELHHKMVTQGLSPKTVVAYEREPFVYAPGNVRVTLDTSIRTGLWSRDVLDEDLVLVGVPDDPIILEVKWDEFLPSIIADAVCLVGRRAGSYSKYVSCRSYDEGICL